MWLPSTQSNRSPAAQKMMSVTAPREHRATSALMSFFNAACEKYIHD